jgi:XTP/dITP diphosphohydrolase
MQILIASNNPHKIAEFRDILGPHGYDVVSPAEIDLALDVPEYGRTFAENARAKAEAYRDASGRLTLADDSGLVVDALNGEPGVYSARYGGEALTDLDRTLLVLERMRPVADEKRSARFVAALAVAAPDAETQVFEGSAEGFVTREPRGEGGFGYDPIFFYPPAQRTFAELSADEKAAVSHRGKAARAAAVYLTEAHHE